MKIKFTVKQVLEEQERLTNLCYDHDEKGLWPLEDVRWSFDEEEQLNFEKYAVDAIKYWPLTELDIDDTRAILSLQTPGSYVCLHFNWIGTDRFILFGEIKQASGGHICVFNMRLQQMYTMIHTNEFALVPPAFC